MSHRCPAAVFTVITVVAMWPLSAAAQTRTAEAAETLRTPWGAPDLQGIWNNATLTPLERPAALADREFLTEEEVARREQAALERDVDLANRPARRTEVDPTGNVDRGVDGAPGSYNSFWMDLATTVVPTRRTSLIVDPPNGRLPPLTPEAEARLTSPEYLRLGDVRDGRVPADGPEQMGLSERCLWYRGIPSFPTGYNNNYQIFQTPDYVVMLQEHIHDVRYIPIDGRPHLPPSIRQYAGDSRAHWEGDTLVVETTNLRRPFIRKWNRPGHSMGRGDLSDDVHVVERFTRLGPDTLGYEFTVDDPNTWTRPWSGSLPMARSDGPMFEFACHEGNYGMTNMLTGSRADEKAAAASSR